MQHHWQYRWKNVCPPPPLLFVEVPQLLSERSLEWRQPLPTNLSTTKSRPLFRSVPNQLPAGVVGWAIPEGLSEGSERIIQVPGCDDCTGIGHDKHIVSVVVARLGADVSNVFNDSVSMLYQKKMFEHGSGKRE